MTERSAVLTLERLEQATITPFAPLTPDESRLAALEILELRSIACAAVRLVDAWPGKTTGPMWNRLITLLLDRVRRGLASTMEREKIDARTGRPMMPSQGDEL